MKKLLLLVSLCLAVLSAGAQRCEVASFFHCCTSTKYEEPQNIETPTQNFVDLGLPSGTLWKDRNEEGFYNLEQALSAFGSSIPAVEQFKELKRCCRWSWTGSGYKVTGPNGKSLLLPAVGYRDCDDCIYDEGTAGNYWSSTPFAPDYGWYMYISASEVGTDGNYHCVSLTVRLVRR